MDIELTPATDLPNREPLGKRTPSWSVIVPTYRRCDVLEKCLDRISAADLPADKIEVLVYDNGSPETSGHVVAKFKDKIRVRYTENPPGHGLGYSLCLGASEAAGNWLLELNDDALIPPNLFRHLENIFDSDPTIGVIGIRAIESGYISSNNEIGSIDSATGEIVGNFDRPTNRPIDVEHVYGFCYAYRRELLLRGGNHDYVLLARDYSSGNRIETDHCLTAKRLGFRVLYDGSIAAVHLAKPRGDLDERSLVWKLNYTRNTLYLFLKHFGWTGRRCLAIRFALLHDLGLRSAILQPSQDNWRHFITGLRARTSAIAHWVKYHVVK